MPKNLYKMGPILVEFQQDEKAFDGDIISAYHLPCLNQGKKPVCKTALRLETCCGVSSNILT